MTIENEDISVEDVDSDADSLFVELDPAENDGEKDSKNSTENLEDTGGDDEVVKSQYGQRAQKRIRKLVGTTKNLESERDKLREELEAERKRVEQLSGEVGKAKEASIQSISNQIESELDAARRAYKEARNVDDSDAEIEAMERITAATARRDALERYKKSNTSQATKSEETEGESEGGEGSEAEAQGTEQPEVHEATKKWLEANTWIQEINEPNPDPEVVEMAQLAARMHRYATEVLLLDPIEDSTEYWGKIDGELHSQYPHRFVANSESEDDSDEEELEVEEMAEDKPKPVARQTVARKRTPATGGKKKVKAKPHEVEFARKYNVPLERVVRERAKLEE